MGQETSFRSKAAHFVSDLTTVFLNPISDKTSKKKDDMMEPQISQEEPILEGKTGNAVDGPDTTSFTAFLYSLLSSESGDHSNSEQQNGCNADSGKRKIDPEIKESSRKKSLFSRSKKTLGKAIYQAARLYGYRNQPSEHNSDCNISEEHNSKTAGLELKPVQTPDEAVLQRNLPQMSEPSLLLSEKMRSALYDSLPALAQGRKWVLLYSTWRHGISLSTMYRRSMICPGFSLLVVGDRKGAIFGGLVEAPLTPTSKRKYQGTNNTFVFTNTPGHPVVFYPTGLNRYFTLCSTDFLALGGGGHFALYLDGDLLNGSSSVSETYGNPCLAHSEAFDVKEVELWGFTYASKYEETVALCRTEAPGICRWCINKVDSPSL